MLILSLSKDEQSIIRGHHNYYPKAIFNAMNKSPQDYLALALDNISSLSGIAALIDATAPLSGFSRSDSNSLPGSVHPFLNLSKEISGRFF